MMKGVAAAVSLALLASGAQAQTIRQKAEISKRCGKQGAEVFAKSEYLFPAYYENHYNFRLKTCFYLVTIDIRGEASAKTMTLFDLNENREIASYTKLEGPQGFCFGQGMPEDAWCGTENEWRALIKPFMEN
jgi:hypothetical protein